MQTVIIAADAAGDSIPWLGPVITLLMGLAGGGGIVAWFRLRHDKRIGVAQQEVAEDDALAKRWQAIIETQTKVLLEPMKQELADVKAEVREVKGELETSRKKYWSAVTHIRTLYNWIARHMPDGLDHTQVPAPPAALAEDI